MHGGRCYRRYVGRGQGGLVVVVHDDGSWSMLYIVLTYWLGWATLCDNYILYIYTTAYISNVWLYSTVLVMNGPRRATSIHLYISTYLPTYLPTHHNSGSIPVSGVSEWVSEWVCGREKRVYIPYHTNREKRRPKTIDLSLSLHCIYLNPSKSI